MMKKFTKVLVALLLIMQTLKAQDIHYSQFYASPLTLNPAMTGVIEGNYRVGLMYRNQWASVTTPYVTPSISFDINNLLPTIITKGTFSGGLEILNDKAGDGNLSTLSVLLSAGYARPLDAEKKLNFSVGLQTGFTQKTVDFSKLFFEDQFTGSGFDQTIASETGQNFGNLALNLGTLITYHASEKLDVFGGLAGFNLMSPKESFLNDATDNRLGTRSTIHLGARYAISDKLDLLPTFLMMGQSKNREMNIGTAFGYKVNPDFNFYIGGYLRNKDAMIVMIGGEYKKVRLGLSYDVNTSTLRDASKGKGAFELSLTYVGLIEGSVLEAPIMWCPRF